MTQERSVWYENDDFWRDFKDEMFSPERWESANEEVERILTLTATEPGSLVLDLCCGPGRHTLELARRGYALTAVDRTRQFLDLAHKSAETAGLSVEFVQSDMREFMRPDTFDLVLSMFTSFGYFENPEDDRRVVENIFRSLKPEGHLILETISKEILARIWQPSNWSENEDGTLFLQERKVTDDFGWVENRWILIRNGQRKDYRFAHRPYSAVELRGLLKDVGFVLTEFYGGLDGSPYDHQAKRMVVVATK